MSDGPLQPGDLNCRISLSYFTTGRGPLGEPLPAEEIPAGSAWAKLELVSGRKVRLADQQAVVETVQFTLYPRQVDIDWKVKTKDRIYTVRNVDRSQRDRIIVTGEADGRNDRAGT